MRPLSNPKFYRVRAIRTRPGITVKMPRIWRGMCWGCTTEHGCKQCEYFTCPSCRRMVPWSSGGTDSLDCADCWALTEKETTMREDVTPTISTEEELVEKVRSKLIHCDTFPGQQSTEPPTIKQNIGPNSLISMKTFAIDGPELLPRGGTWALKHACELAEVIGDNSREMFMLTRKDFTQGDQEVPFVVVVSQKASKEEAISAFKRAIEILDKPPEANPAPTKGWKFTNATHEWAVKMRAKEAADKARITAGEGDTFAASEDNILVRQEPACGIGSELAVGTIRGSKIKSGTKALEKIIKRQQDRIESLAARVGDLTALTGADEINRDRLLKATQSKGMSEALAKVEQMVDCFGVPRIYVNDLVTVKPVKAE